MPRPSLPDPKHAAPSRFPGFREPVVDAEDLIGRLVGRRRGLGVSQAEVAARMGTSQPAVARLEARRSEARLSTLERYASALGVTVGLSVTASAAATEEDEP